MRTLFALLCTALPVTMAAGNVTQRVWKTASGTNNRTQTLFWDYQGRLSEVSERDSGTNGYDWFAYYEPLGRKLETQTFFFTNGIQVGLSPQVLGSFLDPSVQFLELGQWLNFGRATWKLYGPDLNGRYGGLNGTGGLDAVIEDPTVFKPLISDARGNVLSYYDPAKGSNVWTGARPTGYGAVPGYRPVPFELGANLAQSVAWRGRSADFSGYIWLGARYYDPEQGAFLNPDPVWNGRDPNYFTFAGGDPINGFDSDGRFGKGVVESAGAFAHGIINLANNAYYSGAYGVSALAYGTEQANQWYGQYWQGFKNTVIGTGRTAYDVTALASYGVVSPFNNDLAYQWYGGSMDRLAQVSTAFTGGGENSGAYRAGFLGFNIATLAIGGEVGTVGRVGETAQTLDRLAMTADTSEVMALKLPMTDPQLAGTKTFGYTTQSGDVFLQPGLSRSEQALTLAHESVHAYLTPQSGPFMEFRQATRMNGYLNSAFLQGTEEILAETFATGSFSQGVAHAFGGQYFVRGGTVVTPWNYFGEAAIGAGAVTGAGIGAYNLGQNLFGGSNP